MVKQALQTGGFIFLAILLGMSVGSVFDAKAHLGGAVDYVILALVFMVLLDAPLDKVLTAVKQPKVLVIAWLSNFAIIPAIGFCISQLFFPSQPLIAIGVAVYFMAPCTDWFLGFVRMANGNTALGGVLLPINMLTQLLLYPVYVSFITQETITGVGAQEIVNTLVDWFFVPAVIVLVIKFVVHKFELDIQRFLSNGTNIVIYTLVFLIFAVNVKQISDHYSMFVLILLAASVFFLLSTIFVESIAKLFKLNYENHALYSMTTTARNAPLMLGLTMTALPDQSLIYAAIIIGMLIEFPYLALQVMRFRLSGAFKGSFQKQDIHLSVES